MKCFGKYGGIDMTIVEEYLNQSFIFKYCVIVEQAIKLLRIVLSIYDFSVGEFPGCDRIT